MLIRSKLLPARPSEAFGLHQSRVLILFVFASARLQCCSLRPDQFKGEIDVLAVGRRAEDRQSNPELSVDAGGGHEDSAILLERTQQPGIEVVCVTLLWQIPECHDRELRRGTGLHPGLTANLFVKVFCQQKFFFQSRSKSLDSDQLQRNPKAQSAEGASQLGR